MTALVSAPAVDLARVTYRCFRLRTFGDWRSWDYGRWYKAPPHMQTTEPQPQEGQ